MQVSSSPPKSEQELLERARSLAGRTLAEIASALDREIPASLRRNKGWVGQILEDALGASAGNRALPDFVELGIEMKTIPVDRTGKPFESTYVCVANLAPDEGATWADSPARRKLARILWVPILSDPAIALASRIVGRAVLWTPSPYEEALLEADWRAHMRAITDGAIEKLTGADGEALQIRPKAANRRVLTETVDELGEPTLTNPRGFYLRTTFTHRLLLEAVADS